LATVQRKKTSSW